MAESDNAWPFRVAPFPPRRPVAGWTSTLSGWCILLTPLAFISLGSLAIALVFLFDAEPVLNESEQELAGFILLAVGAVVVCLVACFPLAPYLLQRGRRLRVLSVMEALRSDLRPPVLLLRSFEDDDLANPTPRRLWFLGRERYETALARVLRVVGPPISIGKPGEMEPELGASRLYVHPEDWQNAVRYFMARAAAVVIAVGRSPGIWWEIGEAARCADPHQLLFFFPYVEEKRARRSSWRKLYLYLRAVGTTRRQFRFMETERQERYAAFCARGKNLFARPLPETLGDAQFLTFSATGEPQLLPTVRPFSSSLSRYWDRTARAHIHFGRTLAPFVEEKSTKGASLESEHSM